MDGWINEWMDGWMDGWILPTYMYLFSNELQSSQNHSRVIMKSGLQVNPHRSNDFNRGWGRGVGCSDGPG